MSTNVSIMMLRQEQLDKNVNPQKKSNKIQPSDFYLHDLRIRDDVKLGLNLLAKEKLRAMALRQIIEENKTSRRSSIAALSSEKDDYEQVIPNIIESLPIKYPFVYSKVHQYAPNKIKPSTFSNQAPLLKKKSCLALFNFSNLLSQVNNNKNTSSNLLKHKNFSFQVNSRNINEEFSKTRDNKISMNNSETLIDTHNFINHEKDKNKIRSFKKNLSISIFPSSFVAYPDKVQVSIKKSNNADITIYKNIPQNPQNSESLQHYTEKIELSGDFATFIKKVASSKMNPTNNNLCSALRICHETSKYIQNNLPLKFKNYLQRLNQSNIKFGNKTSQKDNFSLKGSYLTEDPLTMMNCINNNVNENRKNFENIKNQFEKGAFDLVLSSPKYRNS